MINIAKGTTDPRVEFISQVQIQILNQISSLESQPSINFNISIKHQRLHKTTPAVSPPHPEQTRPAANLFPAEHSLLTHSRLVYMFLKL